MKDAISQAVEAIYNVQQFIEKYDSKGELVNTALGDVLDERHKQVNEHGYDADHDDEHKAGVLAFAGIAYAVSAGFGLDGNYVHVMDENPVELWPFMSDEFHPESPRKDLVRACALLLAEIERIDRIEARHENRRAPTL